MTTDPASVLVFPTVDGFLDTVNNVSGYTQYISPSYWLGELADWLLGQNPWEEASKMIAGDWKMVAESGAAVWILSEFNIAFSSALHQQNGVLFGQGFWTGKAAKDASAYFRGLELALGEQVAPLQAIATEIKKLTLAVNQAQDIIKGLLEDLTDELITLSLSKYVKAGKALLTGDKGSLAAVRAIDKWQEIQKVYDDVLLKFKSFVAATAGQLAKINGHPFKQLSATGYDHTGVKPPSPKPVTPPAPAPAGRQRVSYGGIEDPDNSGRFY